MLVIVLTGGLGAGKSVAARFFKSKDATVLDLDMLAHDLLCPGNEAYRRVIEEFGEGVLAEDGSVDRARLASVAFSSPTAASRLNAAVHPQLLREVIPILEELRLHVSSPRVVVVEVPLLAEVPDFKNVADTVLAISAPESVRIRRLVDSGMAAHDARARIACQAPDSAREALADRVIVNDSSIEHFEGELGRFWDEVVGTGAA